MANKAKTTETTVEKTVKNKDVQFVSTRVFVCADKEKDGLPKMDKFTQNKNGEQLKNPHMRVLVQTETKDKDGKGVLLNLTTFDDNLMKMFEDGVINTHNSLILMNGIMNKGFSGIRVKRENVYFHTSINYLENKMNNKQFEYGNIAVYGHPVDKGSNLEKGKINFLVLETDKDNQTKTKFITLNLNENSKTFFANVLQKNGTFEKTYLDITGTIQDDNSVNLDKFQYDSGANYLSNIIKRDDVEKTTTEKNVNSPHQQNETEIIDIAEMDIPF